MCASEVDMVPRPKSGSGVVAVVSRPDRGSGVVVAVVLRPDRGPGGGASGGCDGDTGGESGGSVGGGRSIGRWTSGGVGPVSTPRQKDERQGAPRFKALAVRRL